MGLKKTKKNKKRKYRGTLKVGIHNKKGEEMGQENYSNFIENIE